MTDSSVNDADFRTTLECAQRFAESLCSVMNVLRAAVCAIQETAVVAWLPPDMASIAVDFTRALEQIGNKLRQISYPAEPPESVQP